MKADKDAEIYDAEHVAAIAEFNEKAALARVAKLEAALESIKIYAEAHDEEWVLFTVNEALKDAPQ